MKKIICLSFVALSFTSMAQSPWSIGFGFGSVGNHSRFSGGMDEANARFHHNEYGSGSFFLMARRTLNTHWSVQAGMEFSSVGFNFMLTEDYSFHDPCKQWNGTAVSGSTFRLPATLIYNSNLNCRNWRWFAGAGASLLFTQEMDHIEMVKDPSVESGQIPWTVEMNSVNPTQVQGLLTAGVEKVFKRGAVLSFGVRLNAGSLTAYTADIKYEVDGTSYNHTFSNKANQCGFYITYGFRPLGSKKAALASQMK